jgi:TATA-box binding protein (TBP) (component of TFIID and TFIIIB)
LIFVSGKIGNEKKSNYIYEFILNHDLSNNLIYIKIKLIKLTFIYDYLKLVLTGAKTRDKIIEAFRYCYRILKDF